MSSATDSLIFLLVLVPKPKICRLEIKGPTNSLTRSFLVFLSGVVVSLDQDARGQSIRINRYETISLCPSSSWPIKKKKVGEGQVNENATSGWVCLQIMANMKNAKASLLSIWSPECRVTLGLPVLRLLHGEHVQLPQGPRQKDAVLSLVSSWVRIALTTEGQRDRESVLGPFCL